MAEAGTDDTAHHSAFRHDPIREYDRQRNLVREPEHHDAALAVVPARVIELDVGPLKDQRRELEVKPALDQVPRTLGRIPVEGHNGNLRLYIHRRKGAGPFKPNYPAGGTCNQNLLQHKSIPITQIHHPIKTHLNPTNPTT